MKCSYGKRYIRFIDRQNEQYVAQVHVAITHNGYVRIIFCMIRFEKSTEIRKSTCWALTSTSNLLALRQVFTLLRTENDNKMHQRTIFAPQQLIVFSAFRCQELNKMFWAPAKSPRIDCGKLETNLQNVPIANTYHISNIDV